MNSDEMVGKAFLSIEIRDKIFFSVVIVKELQHDNTLVLYDRYIFKDGKGLMNSGSDSLHINIFNEFYKERLEYSHKAITIIFGGNVGSI